MVNEGYRQIQVICEDTDVFVILLHNYRQQQLSEKVPSVDVLMQYPPRVRKFCQNFFQIGPFNRSG